jgi:hypothetical protein
MKTGLKTISEWLRVGLASTVRATSQLWVRDSATGSGFKNYYITKYTRVIYIVAFHSKELNSPILKLNISTMFTSVPKNASKALTGAALSADSEYRFLK